MRDMKLGGGRRSIVADEQVIGEFVGEGRASESVVVQVAVQQHCAVHAQGVLALGHTQRVTRTLLCRVKGMSLRAGGMIEGVRLRPHFIRPKRQFHTLAVTAQHDHTAPGTACPVAMRFGNDLQVEAHCVALRVVQRKRRKAGVARFQVGVGSGVQYRAALLELADHAGLSWALNVHPGGRRLIECFAACAVVQRGRLCALPFPPRRAAPMLRLPLRNADFTLLLASGSGCCMLMPGR